MIMMILRRRRGKKTMIVIGDGDGGKILKIHIEPTWKSSSWHFWAQISSPGGVAIFNSEFKLCAEIRPVHSCRRREIETYHNFYLVCKSAPARKILILILFGPVDHLCVDERGNASSESVLSCLVQGLKCYISHFEGRMIIFRQITITLFISCHPSMTSCHLDLIDESLFVWASHRHAQHQLQKPGWQYWQVIWWSLIKVVDISLSWWQRKISST